MVRSNRFPSNRISTGVSVRRRATLTISHLISEGQGKWVGAALSHRMHPCVVNYLSSRAPAEAGFSRRGRPHHARHRPAVPAEQERTAEDRPMSTLTPIATGLRFPEGPVAM